MYSLSGKGNVFSFIWLWFPKIQQQIKIFWKYNAYILFLNIWWRNVTDRQHWCLFKQRTLTLWWCYKAVVQRTFCTWKRQAAYLVIVDGIRWLYWQLMQSFCIRITWRGGNYVYNDKHRGRKLCDTAEADGHANNYIRSCK